MKYVIFCLLVSGCASQKQLTCNERYKENYLNKCYADCTDAGDWCYAQCEVLAAEKFCN